jgi:diphthine-ammonia ligase
MYGLHLCGEGGEYETLVLDAPIFRSKLELVESNVIKHSNDDVWYLSLRVEPRSKPNATTDFDLAVPPLLDDRAKSVADSLEITKLDDLPMTAIQAPVATKSLDDVKDDPKWSDVERIVNLSPSLLELPPTMTFEAEVRALLDELQRRCVAQMKSTNDIAFVSLILRNMNDFSLANDIYKTYFTRPNPPARICIQADIADRVQLSVVLQEGSRAGLHVQGRSYWAPANIGPYSQAIIQNGIIYQAGQIGLLPASLMIASGAITQGTLSLQHLWRVLHAVGGSQWGSAVCYVSSAKNVRLAEKIWGCWHSIDVDDDDFYKVYTGPTSSSVVSASLLIAVVPGLPRGAEIEWSALGIHDSYLATPSQDDDDSEGESSFISPVSRAAVALGLHVMFGHYTIDIIGTDSWEDIACAIGAGFLVTSTVLASGPIPASARSTVEIIPTTNVFYRNQQVTYGAVVVSRSDKS